MYCDSLHTYEREHKVSNLRTHRLQHSHRQNIYTPKEFHYKLSSTISTPWINDYTCIDNFVSIHNPPHKTWEIWLSSL